MERGSRTRAGRADDRFASAAIAARIRGQKPRAHQAGVVPITFMLLATPPTQTETVCTE